MSEFPVVSVSTPAELASAVPYLVGYQPSDEQFVVAGLADGAVAVMACASWEPSFDDVDGGARSALKGGVVYITDAMEPAEPDSYIVLGYGPQGRDRAVLVGGEIEELTRQHVWQLSVEPDGVVARFEPEDMDWSTYQMVPDKVEAELVYMGIPGPTETRQDLLNRFVPYPEPTWEAVPPAEQVRIDESLPSARAAEAVQLLAGIKANTVGDSSAAQGRLAHLMRSSKDVRDAVLVDAVETVSGAALLELYRGAPIEYRDVTGAVASVMVYIEEGKNIGAAEIISRVAKDSEQGALADMMSSAVDGGLPPRMVREVMSFDPAPILERADTKFLGERTQKALAQAQDSLARPASIPVAVQPELGPKAPVQRGPGVVL